ncbi:hypothetical protein CRUP_000284, partial [Coryphaenoides rupestris]
MTRRVCRDVKLLGACLRCLGSGHWCGVNREKGGHVATGFLQRACCSRRYSVMMPSSAGGEGRWRSSCFFMAGLWLKAPWSDFCRSTRGFLPLGGGRAPPTTGRRSRVKAMRPGSSGELWAPPTWASAEVEGNGGEVVAVVVVMAAGSCCDNDDDVVAVGRFCVCVDEEEEEAWRALMPLAIRGVRGRAARAARAAAWVVAAAVATAAAAAGGGAATTRAGKAEVGCAWWCERMAMGRALAVSLRPLATRWLRMSSSSSFSGKEIRDCATTLARCSHASDTSVPISSGLPEMRSISSAANLQNLTCLLRLSCSTGSFISCWMCPLLKSGSLLMICRTEEDRDRPTSALQASARI